MDTAHTDSARGDPRWLELAKRAGDGLEVALLWNRSNNRVKVAVSDQRLCHHLDFEVAPADALSAFYHPFANAAARLALDGRGEGIATGPIPTGSRRDEK